MLVCSLKDGREVLIEQDSEWLAGVRESAMKGWCRCTVYATYPSGRPFGFVDVLDVKAVTPSVPPLMSYEKQIEECLKRR